MNLAISQIVRRSGIIELGWGYPNPALLRRRRCHRRLISHMATRSGPAARFAALRSRNFTLLFTGLIVSNTGTWMQNVAAGWLIVSGLLFSGSLVAFALNPTLLL